MTKEQNKSSSLPEGWAWTRIGDISDKISNGLSKKQKKNGVGFPVTRIETISDAQIDLNRVGYVENLSEELVEKYRLKRGDILFSNINSDPHLGKTAIFEKELCLIHGMNLLLIRPNNNVILPTFLNYICNYYRQAGKFITIAHRAVNQSSINQTNLKKLEIPLAPLAEQGRIASMLEELFTRLDAGVESLRNVKAQLQLYRQAVLKHAFNGKLTEEWRKTHKNTIQPATKLLEEIRQQQKPEQGRKYKEPSPIDTSELPELPQTWLWARLDRFSELITKGESPKWQGFDYVDKGIPFIRSQNVLWGKVDLSNATKIPKEFHNKLQRSHIKPDDVLVNLVGASIGRCGVVPTSLESANINQAVALIRTKPMLVPSYLMYVLISPWMQNFIHSKKVETARPNISLSDLRNLLVPLSSIEEQHKIVEEIERCFSVIEQSEKTIEQNLNNSEKLRQSILKRAFEGKLVAQDPSDEPADVLLKRIRKEKERQGNQKKGTRTRKSSNRSQRSLNGYVE